MSGGAAVNVSVERQLQRLQRMALIRFTEDEILRLRTSEDIVGSVHLCNGQEAICVGACAALDLPRDLVFPTYRGHGWALACGVPPELVLAELLGRESGINGGRGGSAYFTAPGYGMMGENSIVGAGAPIAAGAALAATWDGSGRVAVAVFGDGALNQGSVHEAMNFAAVRRLPVIFVVENNKYSEMTPIKDMVRNDVLFKRAGIYGFMGARVDGNDAAAVEEAMTHAVQRARSGGGPVLLEFMTERLVGHYIGDAEVYRPPGDKEAALEGEPITRLSGLLLSQGVSQDTIEQHLEAARGEVERASQAALAAPLASTATVLEHLHA